MSTEHFAEALAALDDVAIRARVAAGELGAAGATDLTEEERSLLVGAALDYPEVVGLAYFPGFAASTSTSSRFGPSTPADAASAKFSAGSSTSSGEFSSGADPANAKFGGSDAAVRSANV